MTDSWILWFDDLGLADVPRARGRDGASGEPTAAPAGALDPDVGVDASSDRAWLAR